MVHNHGEPRGNGLEWARDERRENTIERSEFETQLGSRKNGINVLVTGIGEDLYTARLPYTAFPMREMRKSRRCGPSTLSLSAGQAHDALAILEQSKRKRGYHD